MRRFVFPVLGILALISFYSSVTAWAQGQPSSGKNCRMEQQCR